MNAAMLTSLLVASSGAQADFDAANERALAGDAEQAEALYRAVLERGFEDSDVYFNLGCALAPTRPVEAILAYEKALDLDSGDLDARRNLDALRARVAPMAPKPAEGAPPPTSFARSTTASLWAWACAVGALIGGLFGALRGAKGAPLAFTLLGLSGVGGAMLAGALALGSPPRGVVMTRADLREGPDARFSTRAQLVPGETVELKSRDGRFIEVRRADGVQGFVDAEQVVSVRPGH